MTQTTKYRISFPLIILALAATAAAQPQKKTEVQPAPVPGEILSARKVFISNEGASCESLGWFSESPAFSGGPNRAYDQFYRGVANWGHYQLTDSPGEADLNFEIEFSCPAAGASVDQGHSSGPAQAPELRLTIRDVKTRIVLWTLIEPVFYAHLQGNRDKNFDRAMARLVNDLKALVAKPTPPGPTSSGQ